MPILIEHLLARADAPQLSEMMPPGAAKLLGAIDSTLVYPKNLIKVLLALKSPRDLIADQSTRNLLLDLLPVDQAKALSVLLGADDEKNPYEFLLKVPFSRTVPLQILFAFLGVGTDEQREVELGESDSLINAEYPLFEHQITALRDLKEFLAIEPYRALLHMPTGSGKTRTAMNLIADHLRSNQNSVVVWLAHSEELCQQAASEFEKAWAQLGNRKLRLARFWGEFDSDLTELRDGIVIAGLAKSFARLKTDDKHFRALSSRCPFVVMDEAHQAIAPTYQQIIELLVRPMTKARLLGLSATPGRTWNNPNADEELSNFFARRKVALRIQGYSNPVQYLIDKEYLAIPQFRRITSDAGLELNAKEQRTIEETFDLPTSVLDRLGLSESRNLLIVSEIERLASRHKRVLVFASSVDQSDLLAAVLNARGFKASSVSSRNTSQQRGLAIEDYMSADDCTRILCNYGVLTTGFDAPRTSAALIARPTLSLVLYSQMIGRAMRGPKAGGNLEAEIVTVADISLPGFDSVESAFANWEDVWKQA